MLCLLTIPSLSEFFKKYKKRMISENFPLAPINSATKHFSDNLCGRDCSEYQLPSTHKKTDTKPGEISPFMELTFHGTRLASFRMYMKCGIGKAENSTEQCTKQMNMQSE